ncbi:MAG: ABC transporter ATP-binding protein [Archaeoglobaceae archaeon]
MSGILLKNVSVSYSGRKVLRDLNLSFPESGLSLVIGPNGAGKTTLLKVIAGLVSYEGNVYIGGKIVDKVPPNRRKISYVPQNSSLIPNLRVWENIALGLFDRGYSFEQIGERVETYAKLLNVDKLLNKYPATLSGGEARRVSIARALAFDSDVILMDEPEISIDSHAWRFILDAIFKIAEDDKRSLILITHNFEDLIPFARNLCVLFDGKVVFSGDPSQINTENLPIEIKTWLGTVIEVDEVVNNGHFCEAFLDSHRIYAGRIKRGRKIKRVLVLPKFISIDSNKGLKGKVVNVFNHADIATVFIDVGGQEIVFSSRDRFQKGEEITINIEKVIPLCDDYESL